MKNIFLFLLIALYSCGEKWGRNKINPASVELVNKIIPLVSFADNPDSCRKALLFLDSATKIDRNNFSAYDNKLMFLGGLKQYPKAIATLDEMLRLRPHSHDLIMMKGNLFEIIGDTLSSKKCFLQSLEICNAVLNTMKTTDRDYLMFASNKAINLIMLGDSAKANSILKTLYDNQPDDPQFDNVEKKYILFFMHKSKLEILHLKPDSSVSVYYPE